MLLIASILAGVYLLIALGLSGVAQSMNPTGRIRWGEFIGLALAVWLAFVVVTVILAAIVGGLLALFR